MKKYVIGIDFGTLSARCVIADGTTGDEIAESVFEYPHGVMDRELPNGEKLPSAWALQHPKDYLDALETTIPDALKKAGITPDDIAGMGMDFTACTVLPVDENGVPLCMLKKWENEKNAYVKLWKHHAAQPQADRINALARGMGEGWIEDYGGKLSSEFAIPKILQILEESPEVYDATARFTEAADWLSLVLTGNETHGAAFAGYKATWNAETGYPPNEFFKALDPRLDGIVGTKISEKVVGMDGIAGTLCENGAALTGLNMGTPVAIPMIDGHAGMPALGVTGEGCMMIILGTSACQIINSKEKKTVKGICGYVKDGVIPGYYTYEAGQPAVGDIFDWFVNNCVPSRYENEAREKGISVHALLRHKAETKKPGETGLIALDWWNGNRSVLGNSALSGTVVGMTLNTRPEDIYRALIEATGYGLRTITDRYEGSGVHADSIVAAGGIARKDPMMMQIYADILGRPIRIAGVKQAGAMGSAMYAAVAGGLYPDIKSAAEKMVKPDIKVYNPIPENHKIYSELYAEYKRLHDYFGTENGIMENLNGKRK